MSKRTIILPNLEPWQLDAYKDIEKSLGTGQIFSVVAKRQVGKSILAEVLLIKFCLEHSGSTSIMVEPTQAQCRRCFKQILRMLKGSRTILSSNSTLLNIEFVNGAEIQFKSAEQDDALRGMTVDRGILVIDEAAFISDEIIDIILPCVDATNSPVLYISTPLFESGRFYEMYKEGLDGTNPIAHSYNWSNYDTSKFLTKAKLEFYKKTVAPNRFISEYLGLFIKEGSYIFGEFKKLIREFNPNPPVYGGIDWGSGLSNDYTVLTLLDKEGNMTHQFRFNDIEPTEQIEKLVEIIKSFPTLKQIFVEHNSIGAVYYDMLKKRLQGLTVKAFVTTNESKRRVIEQLILAFDKQEIHLLDIFENTHELQNYAMQKTGKNGYTYNGINGVHDDCVISLALAYEAFKKKPTSIVVTK